MATPISTYKVFLLQGEKSATLTASNKLIDIKDFPDLGQSPDMLETTTLSDGSQTYIPGIQNQDSMEFTANYSLADYIALKALEGVEKKYAVWFGGTVNNGVATPTGSNGKFEFDGFLTVSVSGGGVNEVVEMTITIAPSSTISQIATVPSE